MEEKQEELRLQELLDEEKGLDSAQDDLEVSRQKLTGLLFAYKENFHRAEAVIESSENLFIGARQEFNYLYGEFIQYTRKLVYELEDKLAELAREQKQVEVKRDDIDFYRKSLLNSVARGGNDER